MTDLFSNDPANETTEFETPNSAPDTPVAFTDLVGPEKKYKTEDDVAKAIIEKDRFIEQLKRENAASRQAHQERESQEALLARIEAKLQQLPVIEPTSEDTRSPLDEQPTQLTTEDVEALLEKRDALKRRTDNIKEVETTLTRQFGDAWKSHIREQAKELRMSTEDLTQLAAESPQAFFRLVGVSTSTAPPKNPAPPQSSLQTPPNNSGTARNWEHYERLRREKGNAAYFSASVQQQLWKDIKAIGEDAFYGR